VYLLNKYGTTACFVNGEILDNPETNSNTNDKERRQKNDKVDACKLCEHLQSRKVKSIYIPEVRVAEWTIFSKSQATHSQ
jgi:hypothetical protein